MATLLVVGSAPCLYDDVKRALALRPFATTMLVNGACTALEDADHVLAGHTDKAGVFDDARRARFPKASWQLHASCDPRRAREYAAVYKCVTNWHGKDVVTGAGSIGKAARIGFKLGFDEVIMCGSPMDGSGYFIGEAVTRHDGRRIGDPEKQEHRVIAGYRKKLKELAESEFKGRVFSMSGFTRACLGEPR